jgi:hypothetical protein
MSQFGPATSWPTSLHFSWLWQLPEGCTAPWRTLPGR